MPEREILLHCLVRVVRRLQFNRLLRELGRMACTLFGLLALYEMLAALSGSAEFSRTLSPLFLFAALICVAFFAARLLRGPTLAQAATATDTRANLNDELASAYWFTRQAKTTEAVDLVVQRAARTAHRIDARTLFPVIVPRSLLAAAALALTAGMLAWLAHRTDYPGKTETAQSARIDGSTSASGLSQRLRPHINQAAGNAEPAAGRSGSAVVASSSEDAPPPSPQVDAVRQQDPGRAPALHEALRSGPTSSSPDKMPEQMSAELSAGIMRRLQQLLERDEASGSDAQSNSATRATINRQADDVTGENQQASDDPAGGRHSLAENALNAVLRAISRSSVGDREAMQAEGQGEQQAARSTGAGAMGRRIDVTRRGAGEGETQHGDPGGDAASDPVAGKPTQRLAAQLQRIRVERNDSVEDRGTPEAFYAATRAQAARQDYQEIAERSRGADARIIDHEQLPLAYRGAVKKYFLAEHAREK